MKALKLKKKATTYPAFVQNAAIPVIDRVYDILVRVEFAGICRTDIAIATGCQQAAKNITLGHEFCGKIVEIYGADEINGLKAGMTVSADPMHFMSKPYTMDVMCGRDCDGAFAEYIAVPHDSLYKLNPEIGMLGAFLEPVAAAMAPYTYLNNIKTENKRIAVYGNSRIAELAMMVGHAMGYNSIEKVSAAENMEPDTYDVIIETEPDSIQFLAENIKPGGTIIVKSRAYYKTPVSTETIAMKEITLAGVRYGDFNEAAKLLEKSKNGECEDFTKLFNKEIYTLEQGAAAIMDAASKRPAQGKTFIKICAE